MRITTIGTGTVALSPTRSCAAHLMADEELLLLLDCGSGTTRRLAELGIAWQAITHVALTHFHIDHHGDLPTLLFAFRYGMLPARTAPLEIIGPAGTRDLLDRLAAAYGEWVTAPDFPLIVREIAPGERLPLSARVELSCCKVPHTDESVAYSMGVAGHRIVYTGDTGVSPELGDWAAGCDLLLAECSLPDAMAIPSHLTPAQVGDLAARASARHLVLTHLYPPVETVDITAEVRRSYAGPLTIATDGWTHEIEDG